MPATQQPLTQLSQFVPVAFLWVQWGFSASHPGLVIVHAVILCVGWGFTCTGLHYFSSRTLHSSLYFQKYPALFKKIKKRSHINPCSSNELDHIVVLRIILIIMKNFNRRNTHTHMDRTHSLTHLTSTQLQPRRWGDMSAQLLLFSACWVCWCLRNPPTSDMDCMLHVTCVCVTCSVNRKIRWKWKH